jgi:hypothetical protein
VLLPEEPPLTGDERWGALLGALAEQLAAFPMTQRLLSRRRRT